jgi:dihydrodipicolinate synthase/N-acetylneuraminate lyase
VPIDPLRLLRPERRITGMAAVFLPFADGEVDWAAFDAHLARTVEAGLVPAVNMDTGFVDLLDAATRTAVLERARDLLAGTPFVAGAVVLDHPGADFDPAAHLGAVEAVAAAGATPVVFPSYGLSGLGEAEAVEAHARLGDACGGFIAFELGEAFVPFGRIFSLGGYRELLGIAACVGVKHSSLDRGQEWERLALRARVRPEFRVLTGNDLAIDMVMYGSDYLLGLATFAPELFARRDRLWAAGDPEFHEANDALQFLGAFAFRTPVPAYKHSAAQFLHLRGWVGPDAAHPKALRRPESDRDVLATIGRRLGVLA